MTLLKTQNLQGGMGSASRVRARGALGRALAAFSVLLGSGCLASMPDDGNDAGSPSANVDAARESRAQVASLEHDLRRNVPAIPATVSRNGDGPYAAPADPWQQSVSRNQCNTMPARDNTAVATPTFGYGQLKLGANLEVASSVPVVFAFVKWSDQDFNTGHDESFYRDLFFSLRYPNVRGFFLENSAGKLNLTVGGVAGTFTFPDDAATRSDESRFNCVAGRTSAAGGLVCPDSRRDGYYDRRIILEEVGRRLDLRRFDRNADGKVTRNELLIVAVSATPPRFAGGGAWPMDAPCVDVGSGRTRTSYCTDAVPILDEYAAFSTFAHELTHALGLRYDYYHVLQSGLTLNDGASVMANGSLAGPEGRESVALDGWARVLFGWARPRTVDIASAGACLWLDPSHFGGAAPTSYRDPIIVYDSRRPQGEFFVVENRQHHTSVSPSTGVPDSSYDADVYESGLTIWSVTADEGCRLREDPVEIVGGQQPQPLGTWIPSVIPAGSDDVFVNNAFGFSIAIGWGRDGVLQATPTPPDTYRTARSIYAMGLAHDHSLTSWSTEAPGLPQAVRRDHGAVVLRWRDGSDSGARLSVSADESSRKAVLIYTGAAFATSECVRAALPSRGYPYVNLARGRPTRQSSTARGGDGWRAVDGDRTREFFAGSVSSTESEASPFWQVDLGRVVPLGEITITHSIRGVRSFNVGLSRDGVHFETSASVVNARLPTTVVRLSGEGQWLRIEPHHPGSLSLAEVEVTPRVNLAADAHTRQSSTALGATSERAVDGRTSGRWSAGSVTHTNVEPQPWWSVDLGFRAQLREVVIFNRTDCCGARLSNFEVQIANDEFNWTTAASFAGAASERISLPLAGEGRFVRVRLRGTDALSLAEVQVFGL